jgi:hypothetical protein
LELKNKGAGRNDSEDKVVLNIIIITLTPNFCSTPGSLKAEIDLLKKMIEVQVIPKQDTDRKHQMDQPAAAGGVCEGADEFLRV